MPERWRNFSASAPLLLDHYLDNATECDVDAICDGEDVYIAGILEHIEEAGVHSGDSACSIPPYTLSAEVRAELERQTVALAKELGISQRSLLRWASEGRIDQTCFTIKKRGTQQFQYVFDRHQVIPAIEAIQRGDR